MRKTANTEVDVTNKHTGAAGDFSPVSTIGEIIFAVAMTPTGHATAGLVAASALSLQGPGLLMAGNYKFLGNCGWMGADTDVSGVQVSQELPIRYEVPGIPIKTGSEIKARAQVLESTQAGNAIVGLCYI